MDLQKIIIKRNNPKTYQNWIISREAESAGVQAKRGFMKQKQHHNPYTVTTHMPISQGH